MIMKVKMLGKVLKTRYYINWDWDYNNYEDILNNTDKYIEVSNDLVGYEEIENKSLTSDKDGLICTITKTEYDFENDTMIYYTDKVVKVIEAEPNQKLERIEYAKRECEKYLSKRREFLEQQESKKWYQFWK